MPSSRETFDDDVLAEIARLADGTLPEERRAEVESRIATSPALRDALERQRAVRIAARAPGVGAPARLRVQVQEGHRRRRRRTLVLVPGLGAVATALLLAAVLVAPGGGGPTIAEAAAFASRPPDQPAPRVERATPTLLRRDVEGVPYPNYTGKFGWRAVGARTDELDGRPTTTVFYEKGGRRVGYTIVSGSALDVPAGARTVRREGVDLDTLRVDGRPIVTWERNGRTCVLSGAAPRGELLTLASWRGKGTVPF